MKLITLLTDFGLRDGYTGAMKGVIYRIAPDAQIADITHSIRPQAVREGALVWNQSYPYFPEGSIHVGVVDPGVGTNRRPIAARLGNHYFICPDNGLITLPLLHAEQTGQDVEIVHLNQPRFWLPDLSTVFHGRDIFAPAAAHLASGTALTELGSPVKDPVRLEFPSPQAVEKGWRGEILSIDHSGSLSTNLTAQQLENARSILVRVGTQEIHGLADASQERSQGEVIAVLDADNNLRVVLTGGSAAQELGVRVGDAVEVLVKP